MCARTIFVFQAASASGQLQTLQPSLRQRLPLRLGRDTPATVVISLYGRALSLSQRPRTHAIGDEAYCCPLPPNVTLLALASALKQLTQVATDIFCPGQDLASFSLASSVSPSLTLPFSITAQGNI